MPDGFSNNTCNGLGPYSKHNNGLNVKALSGYHSDNLYLSNQFALHGKMINNK